jgi:hypothetical protein
MFGSPSRSCSTSAIARRGAPEHVWSRRVVVCREQTRDRSRRCCARRDPKAHHVWIRKQAVKICGVLGVCGGECRAVERRGGSVEQGELGAGIKVGEIDEQISALG